MIAPRDLELAVDRVVRRLGEPVNRYDDERDDGGKFTVLEFGGPLDGRAFTVDEDGTVEEVDR